jgi:preprotein translocase subunit SecY
MILLVGIVSQGMKAVTTVFSLAWWAILIIVAICLGIIAFIVFITEAERRIPVQYAKRVVGRKQYGGQSTHLPMKVNMSGVMPVIFASTICGVPATIVASLSLLRVPSGTTWQTTGLLPALPLISSSTSC